MQRIRYVNSAHRPRSAPGPSGTSRYVGLQLRGLHCQRSIGLISDGTRRCLFGAELEVRIHLSPAGSLQNAAKRLDPGKL
jgi:hypothetical protein